MPPPQQLAYAATYELVARRNVMLFFTVIVDEHQMALATAQNITATSIIYELKYAKKRRQAQRTLNLAPRPTAGC